MKKRITLIVLTVILVTSCEKTSNEMGPQNVPIYSPVGKWASIAYYDGSGWISDPMPHHFEFKQDMSFTFRDHNGVICSGEFELSSPNNTYTLIEFKNQSCGFGKRIEEILNSDTLIFSVVLPPNITQNKVKYIKE